MCRGSVQRPGCETCPAEAVQRTSFWGPPPSLVTYASEPSCFSIVSSTVARPAHTCCLLLTHNQSIGPGKDPQQAAHFVYMEGMIAAYMRPRAQHQSCLSAQVLPVRWGRSAYSRGMMLGSPGACRISSSPTSRSTSATLHGAGTPVYACCDAHCTCTGFKLCHNMCKRQQASTCTCHPNALYTTAQALLLAQLLLSRTGMIVRPCMTTFTAIS